MTKKESDAATGNVVKKNGPSDRFEWRWSSEPDGNNRRLLKDTKCRRIRHPSGVCVRC